MPQRPNKPCLHRGCNSLTRNASGYCDTHQAEAIGWDQSRDGRTSTQRGYGAAWQRLRAWILRRDSGLCQPCAQDGRTTAASEVDHIVSKAEAKQLGWSQQQVDAHDNLRAICQDCHKAKTTLDRLAMARHRQG